MISSHDKEVAHSIRDLVTRMNRRLKKQISNPDQMSISELNVIQLLLFNRLLLPSELCAQLNLSSQYMSQVLNKLEGLGYISRKASPNDKRKSYAALTAKGRRRIEQTREEREEWLAVSISKQYSAKEKETIQKAIDLLLRLPEL